jgi:hypothetical protein
MRGEGVDEWGTLRQWLAEHRWSFRLRFAPVVCGTAEAVP